jgi:hypothetical protein
VVGDSDTLPFNRLMSRSTIARVTPLLMHAR